MVNLVAPVLREYENRETIYLMRNPPSNKNLKNLPAYRRKVMWQLKRSLVKH